MLPIKPKKATKRKIKTQRGEKIKSKRKMEWTLEDIPSVDTSNIERVKLAQISKNVDLETPLHMMVLPIHIEKSTLNHPHPTMESSLLALENSGTESSNLIIQENGVEIDRTASNENNVLFGGDNEAVYYANQPIDVFDYDEKDDDDIQIREKDDEEIKHVEISKEQSEGKKITILNVKVIHPPQSNGTDGDVESNSYITTSSLGGYVDTEYDNQSDSSRFENFHGSTGDIENTEQSSQMTNKPNINLKMLINGDNPIWEEITKRYKEIGVLSKKHRKSMLEAIVRYALVKNVYIDPIMMSNISLQICKLFPTETMDTYFLKVGNKFLGKLYNLYHRNRAEYLKEQKERVVPETPLVEPSESIDILKSDGGDDNLYIQNWKETFIYRQKKILQYQSFDDFLDEWPIISKPIGPLLINMDFEKTYGNRSLTSNNWNLFFTNNWAHITKNINRKGASFCKKVAKLEESPSKDAALAMILHYLLPPAYGSGQWKPTYVDSQKALLKHIKHECIEREIENRNEKCVLRDIKWHPYVIGQGCSKTKMKHFYVVTHNMIIRSEDFLSALDLCMKIFILLNIPYPPEAKAVWILINKIFYNIKVDSLMTPRILELINDLK